MAETKKLEAMEQEAVLEANAANPQADAPKKNAVAPETSNIASMAKYDDLGAPVVKPTDSNPDATKKSKKAQDQVNSKAQDGHPDATPDNIDSNVPTLLLSSALFNLVSTRVTIIYS